MKLRFFKPIVSTEAVLQQLERILRSDPFLRSERHSRFLRYIVERAVKGSTADLKEYTLALDVCERKESFDPRSDPIVRVEAGRLRAKLEEYYHGPGATDPILIELPKGGYTPVFRPRQPPDDSGRSGAPTGMRWHWAWRAGVSVAVIAGALIASWLVRREPARAHKSGPSLAVLPFLDLSPGGDHEYLSDGITEEIIDALCHIQGVQVVSRTSSFRFKGKNEDVRRIGRELNAKLLVEGSIRVEGRSLRISAQLIDAEDGYHLWSAQYDRQADAVFTVQEEIAKSIAGAFDRQLASTHLFRPRRVTGWSLEARTLQLQGAHFARKWTEEGLFKALELYERAIRIDPEYAPAHAGMADAYTLLGVHGGLPPRQAMSLAKTAALRALAQDPSLAHSHAALGMVKAVYEWDWGGAEKEFQRAIELDPTDTIVLEEYIMAYLLPRGRFDEAVAVSNRGLSLDPVSPRMHCVAGMARFYRREYDQGISAERRAIELDPSFLPAHLALGTMYAQKGMYAEAVASLERGKSVWAGGMGQALLGHTLGSMGRPEEARRALLMLEKLSAKRYVSRGYAAFLHLRLGETERALDALEEAVEQKSASVVYLKVNPRYDVLRSHPRFIALLKKVGLEHP